MNDSLHIVQVIVSPLTAIVSRSFLQYGQAAIVFGCGPVPATSILLAKKSEAQVTSIDNNSYSVKQATSFVFKYDTFNKVRIQHAEAKNFPVGMFDVIIVSQGINLYKELLKRVSQSMKEDARVIFRTSSSPDGKIAQKDLFIKNLFKIDKIVAQKKNGLLISILLFKKLHG